MRWINGSKYIRLSEAARDIAIRAGRFPINDVLMPFMADAAKIILIRGGRGGGKSNTIALRLIQEARTEEYFKCYFGRKVLERVRGSQHQELVKAIKQLKCENEFTFSENTNGSLTISHKKTGNSFFAFGGDNPQSMKSISDPTHIWCDEFDQFDELDFKALYPTLRTIRGKNIFIGSFNSYEITTSHWVVKFFYPESYTGQDKYDFDALQGVQISKYLINYTDNYFIDQEEYKKTLMLSAGGDSDVFDGLAKGEWGFNKKGNEYYPAFKKGVHVGKVPRIPGQPDHLTYDFNLVPYMTLVPFQIYEAPTEVQIRVYAEYCKKPPLNTTRAVTEAWLNDYEGAITDIFYYGDAMGTRGVEGFGDDVTRFDPVREVLFKYLYSGSDRTTRKNLGVLKRRDLLNSLFAGLKQLLNKPVVFLIDESCVETIKDLSELKLDVNGKLKQKKEDPITGRKFEILGHTSDALECGICEVFSFFM